LEEKDCDVSEIDRLIRVNEYNELTYSDSFSINISENNARGAHWAESPCFRAGRPSEPVWVIPAKGSGKRIRKP